MKKTVLSILTCLAMGSWANAQNILYVNGNNSGGDGSGDSWGNAITSLKSALDNVTSSTDEVWVARGTYKPHTSDRSKTLYVSIDDLKVIGGFAGNESTLSERNMSLIHTTNATILSGDLDNDDNNSLAQVNSSRFDNSYQVVSIFSDNVTLDGFTISDGHTLDPFSSVAPSSGAGVNVINTVSNFSMKNCILKRNVADYGAGLDYNPNISTNLTIDACIFEDNNAIGATSFYIVTSAGIAANVQITNSLFKNNETTDSGSNQGYGGTAGWMRAYATGSVINATLVNNTYVDNIGYGTSTSSDFPTVCFSSNNGSFGTLDVANNIFWGNRRQYTTHLTNAFGPGVGTTFPTFTVYNSIDENSFSNFTATNLINTSNSNPNLSASFEPNLNSGAIDAGDNTKVPNGITTDLAGNPRNVNSTVDIGCYENQNTSVLVSSITVQGQGGASTITTPAGTLQMEATVLPANADDMTYTWSVTNGTGMATIDANGVLTASADGTVDVIATANDGSGVTGSTTVTISNQSASINENNISFSIVPNPTSGIVKIDTDVEINSIEIFSTSGQQVASFETKAFDISALQSGVYFVKVLSDSGLFTTKIIRE